MASDRIDITVTKLRTGDSIEIEHSGGGLFITVDVVDYSPSRPTMTAFDTSDIVPRTLEAETAVKRLADAFAESTYVSNVSTNGTVVSVELVDKSDFNINPDASTVTIDTANGSQIRVVRIINHTGSITDHNDPYVPNITIASIQHELIDFGYPSKGAPFGNLGSPIKTTILFTSADPLNKCEYKFGWIDNEDQVYDNLQSYKINNDKFKSLYTDSIQAYTGDATEMVAVSPIDWTTGSVDLIDLGSNNFRLEHTHIIPKLITPDDISLDEEYTTPSELSGANSLRYVTEINLRANDFDINPTESTSLQDLSNFLGKGNIGAFDQVYKTGGRLYTLESYDGSINFGKDSPITATISTNGSAFTTSSKIAVQIQKVTDSLKSGESYNDNISLERVVVDMDGSSTNGTILTSVTASLDGGDCVVSFVVEGGNISDDYAVYFEVAQDPTTNPTNHNVMGSIGVAESSADTDVIIITDYPNTSFDEFVFNYPYSDTEYHGFNEVLAFVEDIMLSRWRVRNLDPNNTEITRFTLTIRERNGEVLERFVINPEDLPYSLERVFKLPDSSLRKEITAGIYFDLLDQGEFFDFTDVSSTWNRFAHGEKFTAVNGYRTPNWLNGQADDSDVFEDATLGSLTKNNAGLYTSKESNILGNVNGSSFHGMYSLLKYESYACNGTIYSTNNLDDDVIGFVIAMYVDDNDIEHTLSLCITTGGVNFNVNPSYDPNDATPDSVNSFNNLIGGAKENVNWGIVYNFGKKDATTLAQFVTDQTIINWDVAGDFDFEVIRNKDVITANIQCSLDKDYDETLEFNLNDSNLTKKFIGNQFIGFGWYSQPDGGFRNVSLRLGVNDWVFKYPFQIWKNWVGRSGVSLVFGVDAEQTLIGGEVVEFNKEFISPVFELGNYDETKNLSTEPQALRSPSSIQFYDNNTGDEIGTILKDVKTQVVATFIDENLGDLESGVVSFPTTMTIANTEEGNLTGYFGITTDRNTQNEYLRFHNIRENLTGTLWSHITGGETNQAKLTIVDAQTATLSAVIDPDLLIEEFGDNFNCLNITARLNKFQNNHQNPVFVSAEIGDVADNVLTITANTESNWGWENTPEIILTTTSVTALNVSSAVGTIDNKTGQYNLDRSVLDTEIITIEILSDNDIRNSKDVSKTFEGIDEGTIVTNNV